MGSVSPATMQATCARDRAAVMLHFTHQPPYLQSLHAGEWHGALRELWLHQYRSCTLSHNGYGLRKLFLSMAGRRIVFRSGRFGNTKRPIMQTISPGPNRLQIGPCRDHETARSEIIVNCKWQVAASAWMLSVKIDMSSSTQRLTLLAFRGPAAEAEP